MSKKIQSKYFDFDATNAPKVYRNFAVNTKKPQIRDDGEVELVLTTERPVVRLRVNESWEYEEFDEVLSMDEGHLRADRLEVGAVSMLDAHKFSRMDDQVGAVSSFRLEGDKLFGGYKPRSNEKSQEIYKDVVAGIIRNVSIGYIVHRYMDVTPDDSKRTILKAIDWEIFEASFVPIGADLDAGVRGMSPNCEVRGELGNNAKVVINKPLSEGENMPQKNTNTTPEPVEPKENREVTTPQSPVVGEAEKKQAAEAARLEERSRVSAIHGVCKKMNLSSERAAEFVEKGTSAAEVREIVIDEMEVESQKSAINSTNIQITRDESDTMRTGIRSAILNKVSPENYELEDCGRAYREMSAIQLADYLCQQKGIRTFGMRKEEVIKRALSSSDLPAIFLDAMNKSLLRSYKEKPQTFEHFVTRVSHSDFKMQNKVRLGDAPALEELVENDTVEYGGLKESKEAFALKTFGSGLVIGERMFINDDLGALESVPAGWGRKVRQLEAKLVYELLTSNPMMGDGHKLFSAKHANQITANTDISVETVGLAEKLGLKQKDLDGEEIQLEFNHMLVPTARKLEAQQFLSNQFIPTKASDVNPFRGNLTPGWDSRLDAVSEARYYLTADKTQIDMMQLATLDGRGPEVSQESDFDSDGMKMKIKHHLAAGVIDYRGFVFVKGA